MNEQAIRNNPELQRILWACHEYWLTEPVAFEQREVCHSWVSGTYAEQFGGTFHQSQLGQLADLGFLLRLDRVRGGSRRYYALVNPDRVADLLTALGLSPSAPAAAS